MLWCKKVVGVIHGFGHCTSLPPDISIISEEPGSTAAAYEKVPNIASCNDHAFTAYRRFGKAASFFCCFSVLKAACTHASTITTGWFRAQMPLQP